VVDSRDVQQQLLSSLLLLLLLWLPQRRFASAAAMLLQEAAQLPCAADLRQLQRCCCGWFSQVAASRPGALQH
jgi:hypothetical protein